MPSPAESLILPSASSTRRKPRESVISPAVRSGASTARATWWKPLTECSAWTGLPDHPGRPVFRGHELDAQTVRVLESEDRIAEAVAGSLEADSLLHQALRPVAQRGGRDGEGGNDELASTYASPGACAHGKNVMMVPGLPEPSP